MRDGENEKYASLFIKRGKAENHKMAYYIENFELKDLGFYKK
jgi:hypothetical protein